MSTSSVIQLGDIMAERPTSVDPSNFPNETFDLYSIPAFDIGEPEVLQGREIGSAKQVVQAGDVLISRIVPHIRRAWVVGESQGRRMIASGEWIKFRSARVHPAYLRHLFISDRFHARFMNTVAGVGGSLIRARPASVARISIRLPEYPEQRRIADVLDRAEALRAKRRAALAELERLAESIFLDMFGDPVTNPRRWTDPTLGALVHSLQYGPRFYNEAYSDEGIRIVRISDLAGSGTLDFSTMPKLLVSEADRAKFSLRPGDLIFARSGATVGKIALIGPNDPPCIAGAYFIVMRFADGLDPCYARAVLCAPSVQRIITSRSRQAAQQNFSGPGLRQLPMPLPPIGVQREFSRRVAAVEKLKAAHRASLAELDALFASLQHRAFRGEL